MENSCRILFQYSMCSPAGCNELRKYKKQIERDEGIAEEGRKEEGASEAKD